MPVHPVARRATRWGLRAAVLALLASCGGGPGDDLPVPDASRAPMAAPASCAQADQRDWLLRYMQDQYYWNRSLGTSNARVEGMDGFFRTMLYQPADRFSYTQTAEEFNQFFGEGRRTGYGYTMVWTDADQTVLRVRAVEPESPVGLAGLKRGDRVLSVDGYTPMQIAAGALARVTTEGVPRTFLLEDAVTLEQRRVVATSANFALTPVPVSRVIDVPTPQGVRKVAYMAYHEFIVASEGGLDRGFSQFIKSGATELVLDLRYNGGGSVLFARALASMIGGKRLEGKTFVDLRFNEQQSDRNLEMIFTTNVGILPGPVLEGLQRVFIITSPGTASASELVINSLIPFMPVVLVGQTTYGKPYGFSPKEACGTVYNAVAFESFNAQGVGGFTAGFSPTCEVDDDLEHALGDPQEARLAAALNYVAGGMCPARLPSPTGALSRRKAVGAEAVLGEQAVPQMVYQR